MNSYEGWTAEESERLAKMIAAGVSHADIAERTGRSKSSVKARAAKLRGKIYKSNHPARPIGGAYSIFKIPSRRTNDDDKHLQAIAAANGGLGFPALSLTAAYRVAA